MKKKCALIFNFLVPVALVVIIIITFFQSVNSATHDNYTFNISSYGDKLKIISGLSNVGECISFENNTINFSETKIDFKILDRRNYNFNIIFLRENDCIFEINNFSILYVELHNKFHDAGHAGISVTASEVFNTEKLVQDKIISATERDIIISSTIVHLRIKHLYRLLPIYAFFESILLIIGYMLYLKPQLYAKIFKKKYGYYNL